MKKIIPIMLALSISTCFCKAQNKTGEFKPGGRNVYEVTDLPLTDAPEGTVAADIPGMDTSGKLVPLYSLHARVTLVYFYDFNCHFCDFTSTELLKLYHSCKNQGVEVYALPLSDDEKTWKSYIETKQLDWINVMNNGESGLKMRTDYHLAATPTIYILDDKKVISSKRLLRAEDVKPLLLEKFNVK